MRPLKRIDDLIFNTLAELEEVNFLSKCRRSTEGIIQTLLFFHKIGEYDNVTLGELVHHKDWMKKLSIDIKMNSHINYIRLYGNRASHYQVYKFSKYDLSLVKNAFKEVVLFYYSSINVNVPKDINNNLVNISLNNDESESYNSDVNLYLQALISVESSNNDYPIAGQKFLSNLCSKIIIDNSSVVSQKLLSTNRNNEKYLDLGKAIPYLKKYKIISEKQISQIDECYTFFRSSASIYRSEKKVPDVPEVLKISFRNIVNWYYRINDKEKLANNSNNYLLIADLFVIVTFLGALLFSFYKIPIYVYAENPIFVVFVFTGVVSFLFAYLYNIVYNINSKLRNRKLYNYAYSISSYSGIIGVLILGFVSFYILNDGRPDYPYLKFFLTTSVWALSLQVSIFIRSNSKTINDRILRYVSIMLFLLIIASIVFLSQFFMKG